MIPGSTYWARLEGTEGKKQRGPRPVVVISSPTHLDIVTDLVIVVPGTTTDRGWDNHVRLDAPGLREPTFAMTEQPRTIARRRLSAAKRPTDPQLGTVSGECLDEILAWVHRWVA